MSKYDALWQYISETDKDTLTLSFEEIAEISGVQIDHSFLRFKKELMAYGFEAKKISMKNESVEFHRI